MNLLKLRLLFIAVLVVSTGLCEVAAAKTLCVNPKGSSGCFSKIQAAVNAAASNDVIKVAAGTYAEDVVVGKPLSLLGSGAALSVIDANNMGNGILVDGLNHAGLRDVTIAGFTVENALYEGILVLNAVDVTVRNNSILNNDTIGPVFGSGVACKGQPSYETDESGDCGGGLHLSGAAGSVVSDNYISGNADGILISDDSGESHDNLIIRNVVENNPAECGVVLASHPPIGATPPSFAPHHGVDHNTVSENVVSKNGVTVGGAGVGLFSDGEGPGRTSQNVIIRNELTGNGIPGVSLHTHVGPAFGLPADDMSGNMIIGNFISGNGADTDDTATPGTAGININSGGGGTPVYGTIISQNIITNEDIAIAVNTPTEVDAHLNDLLNGKVGVANVCKTDSAKCGTADATENFWGCPAGPGTTGCSMVSGPGVRSTPWLQQAVETEAGASARPAQ
ncbi:MAG TPA: right-handed parallel beta-helix repeat-containing protein [Verrucomicrobiae bacterium]|nr:right-handed parallel beta-helix repeat-containing protein [Verrucomicrobiae bacterium]